MSFIIIAVVLNSAGSCTGVRVHLDPGIASLL